MPRFIADSRPNGKSERRNTGVPFGFAQGRLLRCAIHGEAVNSFGRDDALKVVEAKEESAVRRNDGQKRRENDRGRGVFERIPLVGGCKLKVGCDSFSGRRLNVLHRELSVRRVRG